MLRTKKKNKNRTVSNKHAHSKSFLQKGRNIKETFITDM